VIFSLREVVPGKSLKPRELPLLRFTSILEKSMSAKGIECELEKFENQGEGIEVALRYDVNLTK